MSAPFSRRVWSVATGVILGALAAGHAKAQYGIAAGPGYPSAGLYGTSGYGGFGSTGYGLGGVNYGAAGIGTGGYGGIGTGGYGGIGTGGYGGIGTGGYGVSNFGAYGVGNGQINAATALARRSIQQAPAPPRPQTVTNFAPLISAITSLPGWKSGTTEKPHPRRFVPSVPRSQLLDDQGTILWPSAAPGDDAVAGTRSTAEGLVRSVVSEAKSDGHATTRHVIAARKALGDYAHYALPLVASRNAADEAGLEHFIVELEKTLATMAVDF